MERQTIYTQWVKPLSELAGPSGFEHEVARFVEEEGRAFGESRRDLMQNVTIKRPAALQGQALKIHLDAHLDEVGFVVLGILENGTMPVLPLGGWVPSNVPAHAFRILNRDGRWIRALSASKPLHFMSEAERKQGLAIENLVLDVGALSKRELIEDFGIDIGAPVVPDVQCSYEPAHDLLCGKAFDCRVGVAALLLTLEKLKNEAVPATVIAALSAQEEVGERGARVTSREVQADLAIVYEGCPADDTFTQPALIQTALGQGPMLRHVDCSMITHPGFQRYALELAAAKGIPVQRSVRRGGGTNGAIIHNDGKAVPSIVIGVPVRYIHTSYGFAKLADIEHAANLAVAIIRSCNEQTLSTLKDLR